jgi:hypothetical protein
MTSQHCRVSDRGLDAVGLKVEPSRAFMDIPVHEYLG